LHRSEILEKFAPRLQVGVIEGSVEGDEPGSTLGEISEVPYAEHVAWRGYESPYYNDSHIELREEFRAWVHTRMRASGIAEELEASGKKVPDDLFHEMGERGVLAARLGPVRVVVFFKNALHTFSSFFLHM